MAKTIVFLISMTSAVGIRDKEVLAAYNTEEERDAAYAERRNRAEGLYFCSEIVVDLDKVAKDAIAKLTPVERLALREGNGQAHVVKIVATVEYSPEWKESK